METLAAVRMNDSNRGNRWIADSCRREERSAETCIVIDAPSCEMIIRIGRSKSQGDRATLSAAQCERRYRSVECEVRRDPYWRDARYVDIPIDRGKRNYLLERFAGPRCSERHSWRLDRKLRDR